VSTSLRRVTVTDSLDLLAPGIDLLRSEGVEVLELALGIDPMDAAASASSSQAIIVGVLEVAEQSLALLAAGSPKLIVRAGIGYDNVDVLAAHRHGIEVANVPDYCTDEVADHTLMLLLAAERRLTTLRDLGRESWNVAARLPPVHRLRGRTLGLVGFGRIGQQVALRAAPFGYRVVAADPDAPESVFTAHGVDRVDIDELFRTADAISLHCPLSAETNLIVNARRLEMMKSGATLVNTSRGGLVNLDDVNDAVASGRLGSVALDVLDGEPAAPLGHPLLQRPEVLITPHVAWYSLDARRELAIKSAEEVLRSLRGEPLRNAIP